jgi:molybdate/tungstate transport system substrate-binding protein
VRGTKTKSFAIIVAMLIALALMPACSQPTPGGSLEGTLAIYHAGSLAVPFEDMGTEFNNIHPDIEIQRDSGGSRSEIRKITELGKVADILASADYALIPDMMYPEFADWYVIFAYSRMVLCYTHQSKFGDEVNKDNWYEILARDGVVYGHSDPDLDPCGYRTEMVWQLAEEHYSKPGLYDILDIDDIHKNVVRPKSVDLIALLESGDLDYAFEYLSVAKQHSLKYVELPEEIDLSSVEFEDFYATAKVEVTGTEPGTTNTQIGAPIVYGITIPKNAARADLAVEFLKFLLDKDGQAVMERNYQSPVVPAVASDRSKLPEELHELCIEK